MIEYKDFYILTNTIRFEKNKESEIVGYFYSIQGKNDLGISQMNGKSFKSITEAKKFITRLQNGNLKAFKIWQLDKTIITNKYNNGNG